MAATSNLGIQVNLQSPIENESIKIEVDEIPNSSNTSQDSYLQSILSTKTPTTATNDNQCTGDTTTCTCYKCQRHRRRAGHRMEKDITTPPLKGLDKPKRSNTVRKTPVLTDYEKRISKSAYSQQDSIYRFEKENNKTTKENSSRPASIMTTDIKDNYEISWKDEGTGDDLLTSLVTFQSIFETTDKDEGLSDLLEQKAKELKNQNLKSDEPIAQEVLPPRLSDCLTPSYRQGPKHNPLTLYHTMKMKTGQERTQAYGIAFQHCVQSDSGLNDWLKRPKTPPPVKENFGKIQTAQHKPTKRSILSSFRKGSKLMHHYQEEQLFYTSIEDQKKKSTDTLEPTDILSAAKALLPQDSTITIQINRSSVYDQIDVPDKPRNSIADVNTNKA
ncbi:hypothetical protein RO3G_04597 [Rhizopus delemar RA 99-880]|uniref:Uncharacterized protein n=1 Tax=Rhizopus delemar (strain RA 99-880 / ATCC MYA-4621 / FGSC 9543 / NRRL 43880) TaxID=246409 RepID=I1BUL2_RHIO9|nr:hypothetical protein RO3G_04597 [Rhizopus delemar RA 99-880]|eukprot:EIE79892.1 hypothetical protein RO3G_04597 [Rhizopus delemar RA 99-880]